MNRYKDGERWTASTSFLPNSLISLFIGIPLLILLLSFNQPSHAIYIGVVQIDHLKASSTAQIQIKVFADDLTNCLQHAFPKESLFSESELCNNQKEKITQYFNENLSLSINQQSSKLTFQNCSVEQDTYWLKFEMSCPPTWHRLDVSAGFFMELFPTQSNIVQVKNGDEQGFERLDNGRRECGFEWLSVSGKW